jgi:hypothetical protein
LIAGADEAKFNQTLAETLFYFGRNPCGHLFQTVRCSAVGHEFLQLFEPHPALLRRPNCVVNEKIYLARDFEETHQCWMAVLFQHEFLDEQRIRNRLAVFVRDGEIREAVLGQFVRCVNLFRALYVRIEIKISDQLSVTVPSFRFRFALAPILLLPKLTFGFVDRIKSLPLAEAIIFPLGLTLIPVLAETVPMKNVAAFPVAETSTDDPECEVVGSERRIVYTFASLW